VSRGGKRFKRIGLHYIDFPNTRTANKSLVRLATGKIAEIEQGATNFG
jgi:hypothetical protein